MTTPFPSATWERGYPVSRIPLRNPVGLDEGDAGGVVLAADDGGVLAGAEEGGDDGGFAAIGRSEVDGADGLDLRRRPVIVERDRGAVAIVELESGIEQWTRDTGPGERWAHGAENHDGAIAIPNDDPADHDVITAADVAARTQVRQSGAGARRQIVDFDDAVAGAVILTGELGGILAGRECRDNDRLAIIRRSEPAIHDLDGIGLGLPIV